MLSLAEVPLQCALSHTHTYAQLVHTTSHSVTWFPRNRASSFVLQNVFEYDVLESGGGLSNVAYGFM